MLSFGEWRTLWIKKAFFEGNTIKSSTNCIVNLIRKLSKNTKTTKALKTFLSSNLRRMIIKDGTEHCEFNTKTIFKIKYQKRGLLTFQGMIIKDGAERCEMQMRTLKQDAPLPPFIGTIFSRDLKFCRNCKINLPKLPNLFVEIAKGICQNCHIYMSKLSNIFVQIAKCICPRIVWWLHYVS